MNEENLEELGVYDRLKTNQYENVLWFLILVLSLAKVIGKFQTDDELIIPLLLSCLAFIGTSSLLLLSQAMLLVQ